LTTRKGLVTTSDTRKIVRERTVISWETVRGSLAVWSKEEIAEKKID